MLIFVDETGSDKRAALRKYGYALSGRQAVSEKLLVKGKQYSAIAGLHMGGMLDNASIHHVERVVKLIKDTGAIVLFLPPHSTDIMPIEECFSKVKSYLRANVPLIQILNKSEIKDMTIAAFATMIPGNDCYNWIDHCDYMK